ncbi:glutathione S-transferase C-terminal-like protein [Leucogyrophana mollusca]|uniref:Glutathione S-transferase C-terminal-like protein n=1 Tax=Leucogyrophana mollusca TaxID=85980 RepID=A0ACB8BQY6_9AGAM|nr:glutathione S-transferase C-terminal-like protein [Leucogyrophana mollusca]
MAPTGTFYGDRRQRQTKVIQAVAAIAGLELEIAPFEFGVTNKSPEFLTKFPLGKIPAFERKDGFTLTEGAAIARYLSSVAPESGLLGSSIEEAAKIDQWIHFAETEIQNYTDRVYALVEGMTGDYNKAAHDVLVKNQLRGLNYLEAYLSTHTFLINESITLADVTLAATIGRTVGVTLGAAERATFPHIIAFFEKVTQDSRIAPAFGNFERVEVSVAFKEKTA